MGKKSRSVICKGTLHAVLKAPNIQYLHDCFNRIIGATAWQSQASRKLAPASPAVLVSVDFERVFSSLEERVFEQSKAQEIINAITESIEARRQHIESYEQEFELYESGSEKWEELMQEQQLEVLEYQAQVEYRNLKAAREESKGMRRVYHHIREAAATLAKGEWLGLCRCQ